MGLPSLHGNEVSLVVVRSRVEGGIIGIAGVVLVEFFAFKSVALFH